MSGSLGFVITACKAVCLWVELLLRGKARPHIYLGKRRGREGEEMKGKKAEKEREKEDRDLMGTIASRAVKEGCFEPHGHLDEAKPVS